MTDRIAEPKLTPWIDWPTKPVRVGWYDIQFVVGFRPPHEFERRCYWDGRVFLDGIFVHILGIGDQWRGLAEPPKEVA